MELFQVDIWRSLLSWDRGCEIAFYSLLCLQDTEFQHHIVTADKAAFNLQISNKIFISDEYKVWQSTFSVTWRRKLSSTHSKNILNHFFYCCLSNHIVLHSLYSKYIYHIDIEYISPQSWSLSYNTNMVTSSKWTAFPSVLSKDEYKARYKSCSFASGSQSPFQCYYYNEILFLQSRREQCLQSWQKGYSWHTERYLILALNFN